MDLDFNLMTVLISIAMLVISGFSAHFWWTYRGVVKKVEKLSEDSTGFYTKEQIKVLLSEAKKEAREELLKEVVTLQKELAVVKEDTRSMADSVLKSIKGLEDRFDSLMLHLLNKGNK